MFGVLLSGAPFFPSMQCLIAEKISWRSCGVFSETALFRPLTVQVAFRKCSHARVFTATVRFLMTDVGRREGVQSFDSSCSRHGAEPAASLRSSDMW